VGSSATLGSASQFQGNLTLQNNRITPPAGDCNVPSGGVAGSTAVGLPNTGGPAPQPGFHWLPVGIAAAIGALLFGLRRRTIREDS
jgi:hypothetical protein